MSSCNCCLKVALNQKGLRRDCEGSAYVAHTFESSPESEGIKTQENTLSNPLTFGLKVALNQKGLRLFRWFGDSRFNQFESSPELEEIKT